MWPTSGSEDYELDEVSKEDVDLGTWVEIEKKGSAAIVTNAVVARSIGPDRQSWMQAAADEWDCMLGKGALCEAWPPAGATVLPMKTVCSLKASDGGKPRRYKVRAVICGNLQKPVAGEKVYASNADAVTLRISLAAAAQKGWDVQYFDVTAAFLYSEMDEKAPQLHVAAPPLLVKLGVCVPTRSFGWNELCTAFAVALGAGRCIATRPWRRWCCGVNPATWSSGGARLIPRHGPLCEKQIVNPSLRM